MVFKSFLKTVFLPSCIFHQSSFPLNLLAFPQFVFLYSPASFFKENLSYSPPFFFLLYSPAPFFFRENLPVAFLFSFHSFLFTFSFLFFSFLSFSIIPFFSFLFFSFLFFTFFFHASSRHTSSLFFLSLSFWLFFTLRLLLDCHLF